MKQKIILSSDSTCDLGDELKEKYNVNYYPFHIIIGDRQYQDGVDIKPNDIYKAYRERKILPKTAAIGVGEYIQYFRQFVDKGYKVIHINLGSGISSAYQNCCLAAKEFDGNVYPINSCNLSVGVGLLVIEAAEMINKGMCAEDIQKEIQTLIPRVHSSFVLDTLEFLRAGGRCSALTSFSASLLKIKPCIEVENTSGGMHVGKKYRGSLEKVLTDYTYDILSKVDMMKKNRIFIVHSGIDKKLIDLVYKKIEDTKRFKEIHISCASCTISSHCGPNTLGIMYMNI